MTINSHIDPPPLPSLLVSYNYSEIIVNFAQ